MKNIKVGEKVITTLLQQTSRYTKGKRVSYFKKIKIVGKVKSIDKNFGGTYMISNAVVMDEFKTRNIKKYK